MKRIDDRCGSLCFYRPGGPPVNVRLYSRLERAGLGVLAWLILVAPLASAQSAFDSPVPHAAGLTSIPVLIADLDSDGDADLVTSDNDHRISVLLNDGAGGYGPPTIYDLGAVDFAPYRTIAAGDFDGDGDTDLAAARSGSGSSDGVLSILLNHGDGSFAPQLDYAVIVGDGAQLTPHSMAAADLDGDGDVDLAIATIKLNVVGQPGQFSILINTGLGAGGVPNFAPSVTLPATESFSNSIVVDDFDNDGDIDLAVCNRLDQSISWFLNDGSGIAGVINTEALAGPLRLPMKILAGDVNGDGFVDLIVVNAKNSYSLLLNLDGGSNPGKAGRFKDQGMSVVGDPGTPSGTLPTGGILRDLDDDGDLDLAFGLAGDGTTAGSLAVFPNDGTGAFGPESRVGVVPNSRALGATDLDGDGDVDIVATNAGSATVSVFLNRLACSPSLLLGPSLLSWNSFPCAAEYDIVYGSLTTLTESRGDFSVATEACLADNTTASDLPFAEVPAAGEGFWFLIRAVTGDGNQSYGKGRPSQVESRDTEIAVSGNDCL